MLACIRMVTTRNLGRFLPGCRFPESASVLYQRFSSDRGQENMDVNYETLKVSVPKEFVYHVEINRPDKLNSMNNTFWSELGLCFNALAENKDCRSIVLSGAGRLFSAGLDLTSMGGLMAALSEEEDVARKCKIHLKLIKHYQSSITSLEKCPKPVVAAVHSACVGAGVDLITAADIRYCTDDAWFQVKEVDIGLAADVGTLQRLPKVIGNDSLVRELAYTARKMMADEALAQGLVSRKFPDKESMMAAALELAGTIAEKSPVAVQGTKINLNYSRDHSVEEGLDYMALWNMSMLQSEDLVKASMAQLNREKQQPPFSKL